MKEIPVLYENDEILVINKPSGVAVQGGAGIVHSLDRELPVQVGYPVYLVHRLDRDTCGLMVVAKSPLAAAKWTKMIGSKLVRKEYTAICVGTLSPKKGTIRSGVVQHGDEKTAVTHYQVVGEKEIEFESEKIILSTVKLQLETGRMHQIRIHLSKNGCPIAGDDKHGNFKINKLLRKAAGIKTLQLSATSISLPIDGRETVFAL
ncbi:MAG: RluA family pseudouridine synthase [Treponema sp.]|nr:RluA family pseudouridine synthase [Treponema sp.]